MGKQRPLKLMEGGRETTYPPFGVWTSGGAGKWQFSDEGMKRTARVSRWETFWLRTRQLRFLIRVGMNQHRQETCPHGRFCQSFFLLRFVQIQPRRSAHHGRFPDVTFGIVENLPQGPSDRVSIRYQTPVFDFARKHPQAPERVEPDPLCAQMSAQPITFRKAA